LSILGLLDRDEELILYLDSSALLKRVVVEWELPAVGSLLR